jgi:Sulfatase-modifying factor enzyme 1/TIR domain
MIAISYRRDDSLPIAGRLYDRLQAKFGKKNVFMDFDSIPPGTDFREQIKQVIGRSNLVVAIIGPHWLGEQPDASRRIDNPGDFVRLEIAYALEAGIPVIPLLIDTTQMPKPEMLPPNIQELAFRHALPLDSGVDFHSHTDRLIAGIRKAIADGPRSNRAQTVSATIGPVVGTRPTRKIVIWSAAILLVVGASAISFLVLQRHEREANETSPALVVEQSKTNEVKPPASQLVSPPVQEAKPSVAGVAPSTTTSRPADLVATPPPVTAKTSPAEAIPEKESQSKTGSLNVASITKERPYVNSLNMKFIPVLGTKVLFSIWDTRVQDFETFVAATHRSWKKPTFKQEPTHPVTNVSWEDSKAFCAWLTQVERAAGRLSDRQGYRLPTDAEWSVAVGPGKYPWGNDWPPAHGAGNYGSSLHIDDYAFTSPVGTFAQNAAGLYDAGGNVWQWCEDWYTKDMNDKTVMDKHPDLKDDGGGRTQHVVRGGSWFVSEATYVLSSTRLGGGSPNYRNGNNGFRCVLVEEEGK